MKKRLLLSAALLAMPLPLSVAHAGTGDGLPALIAASRLDPDTVDRLYDRAILADGIAALNQEIETMAAAAAPAGQRARALGVAAQLAWKSGDLSGAMRFADRALAIAPDADLFRLEGELLEVTGKPALAAAAYRKARAVEADPARQARLDLRLALIDGVQHPEALAALAKRNPGAIADRLAPVLALLGRPADALANVRPPVAGEGAVVPLCQAEWALAAGDSSSARRLAWQAYGAATSRGDRQYALALMVEAYRDAQDLAGAARFLAMQPSTADMEAARVDVLLELERYDEAIALLRNSADPVMRARLLGVLDLAGRADASRAEYRRMIAADPQALQPYAGLAAVQIAEGDERQALATFQAYLAQVRSRPEALLRGAQAMADMGLGEAAIAAVRAAPVLAKDPAADRFLYETHATLGQATEARQALDALAQVATTQTWIEYAAQAYDEMGDPAAALALFDRSRAGAGYDQLVQMAGLAERAGRRDEALALWQRVWQAESLPARRGYAEEQIVRLARQTGKTDALVRSLAPRLEAATMAPGEIGLLATLLASRGDLPGAKAAIDRYVAPGRPGEVARLNEVAGLYGRMNDRPALIRVLRRLVEIDPAGRDGHVRSLIQALIHDGNDGDPARARELDALLSQLGQRDAADGRLFRATVYAMMGADDRAIAAFRQAWASAPGNADALLQLTAALVRQGRRGKAEGIASYAAVDAATSADFVTAASGLLDLVVNTSQKDSERGTLPRRSTLRWMERRALAWMAQSGATPQLLGLIADLGQQLGDAGMEYRAYAASLADAGDQRAASLRQLVTLSAEEPARKALYGRRLLALHKSYPPDFYADLASTLLAQGDRAGADRAFAMMSDIGGLVNVDAVKGKAFAQADMPALALANYARAVTRDQNNADLVLRTSLLRERQGEDALAFPWYGRTLVRLIAKLPEGAGDGAADGWVEIDRYFETLSEGLVLTWPSDRQAAGAVAAAIRDLAERSLATATPVAPDTLVSHRRLLIVLRLVRRLQDAGHADVVAPDWLARLDARFASDPDYRRTAAFHRDLAGEAVPPVADTDWAGGALQRQAIDGDNIVLALVLAIDARDDAAIRAITTQALDAEIAWRAAMARGFEPQSRPPMFLTLLPRLMESLSANRFRALVLAPIEASPVRDDFLFDVFRSAPDRYAQLEGIAGKTLIENARLFTMVVDHGNDPLGFSARVGQAWDGGTALERFTLDQRIGLYEALVIRLENGGGDSPILPHLFAALVAQPLDAPHRDRLMALARRDLAVPREPGRTGLAWLFRRLMVLDAAPANRTALVDLAKDAAARQPGAADVPAFLQAWYAGDKSGAFTRLEQIAAAEHARADDDDVLDRLIQARFPDAAQQMVSAFVAQDRPSDEDAQRALQRFQTLDGGELPVEQRIAFFRKLVAAAPDEPIYRATLLSLLYDAHRMDGFVGVLQDQLTAHPDDEDAGLLLALTWRLLGQADKQTAVERATGVALSDVDAVAQLLLGGTAEGGIPALFVALFKDYARAHPDDPIVKAAPSGHVDAATAASPIAALLAAQRNAPETVPGLLRALWRQGSEGETEGHLALLRALLDAVSDQGADGQLANAMVARVDVGVELARYAASLDAETSATSPSLQVLIARGLAARGEADATRDRLLSALGKGAIAPRDMVLLLVLLDQQGATRVPNLGAEIVSWMRHTPALGIGTRLLAARVFARAGDMAASRALLQAVLMQALYPYTPLDRTERRDTAPQAIVATLKLWPDQRAAAADYAALVQIAQAQRKAAGGPQDPFLPPFAP